MKKLTFLLLIGLLDSILLFSQGVAINIDGSAPDPSAGLDVNFSNKGFLMPRMTLAQILAITSPANGLQVFCTTDSKMYIYISSLGYWKEVPYGAGICGYYFTVSHTAGNVAPVSKTVTYSTVSNIPGEPTKCWITQNLGADHQAIQVYDSTEASAGWYWQFNRMQGYKHNGEVRTPNTTWITDIAENFDWLTANDPCALLLGNGWRLPTSTEWTNVDVSGSWTNWMGPWNSALKLHSAGNLNHSNGLLYDRGSFGAYWSSMQADMFDGKFLSFFSSSCNVTAYNKTYGYSARCLRD